MLDCLGGLQVEGEFCSLGGDGKSGASSRGRDVRMGWRAWVVVGVVGGIVGSGSWV